MKPSFCIDSNCLITYWELCPLDRFPSLWHQLEKHTGTIVLLDNIRKEIHEKDELHRYIDRKKIVVMNFGDENEQQVLDLQKEYKFGTKTQGCDQNDIKLIAYAQRHGLTVVTQERSKKKASAIDKKNYKIPHVCSKESIPCINFVGLLKALDIKI